MYVYISRGVKGYIEFLDMIVSGRDGIYLYATPLGATKMEILKVGYRG